MTPPTTRLANALRHLRGAAPALVLLLVIGGGLISVLTSIGSTTARSSGSSITASPSKASLWTDGPAREAFAKKLTATPIIERIAAFQRASSWLLLRDLGPEVLQGSNGWLFLTAGLTVHRNRVVDSALRADGVIRIARLLAAKHIALVVMVVPDKSRVEQRHLGEITLPAALDSRARQWSATLTAAGIATVDPSSELSDAQSDTFLKTDTHWNELGSRTAARALAARIKDMHIALDDKVHSTISASTQVDAPGDLLHLAGIDALPASLRPKPEQVQQSAVDMHNDSNDLFSDQGTPSLVLIGTSFSQRSNFGPFLQMESQALVANFAIDGGDFSGSARRYFSSNSFVDHPPKVLIWELPERTIDAPINDAERAWLSSLNGLH